MMLKFLIQLTFMQLMYILENIHVVSLEIFAIQKKVISVFEDARSELVNLGGIQNKAMPHPVGGCLAF